MKDKFNRSIGQHRQIVQSLVSKKPPVTIPTYDCPWFTVYNPLVGEGPFPTLVYIPGNAFVASETSYTKFICSNIAHYARCQVIVIKHRLAPEFQFPAGYEDAYKLLCLLQSPKVAKFLKIDLKKMAIAGYSSGGNLAALMTIQAMKQKMPIAKQILISPVTDLSFSLKGFSEFENQDKTISSQFAAWFANLYVPECVNRKDPRLSPYWTDPKDLINMPSTDIIFGELDRFRSQSELYGKKLTDSGNKVCHFMFRNENHGFLWHNLEVVKTVAARLTLSFNTERLERPILNKAKRITVLHLKQENNQKTHSKQRLLLR